MGCMLQQPRVLVSRGDYETQTGPVLSKAHITLRFIRCDVSSTAWRRVAGNPGNFTSGTQHVFSSKVDLNETCAERMSEMAGG